MKTTKDRLAELSRVLEPSDFSTAVNTFIKYCTDLKEVVSESVEAQADGSSSTYISVDSQVQFAAFADLICDYYGSRGSEGDFATPGVYQFRFTMDEDCHPIVYIEQVLEFRALASTPKPDTNEE